MTVTEALKGLSQSAFGTFIAEKAWAYPTLETFHVIGLGLLFGGLFALAMRMFGLGRQIPLPALNRHILPWVWIGFAINALSGVLLFTSNAPEFTANPAFQVKMALIAVAGINVLIFKRLMAQVSPEGEATIAARLGAAASLAIWTSVITAGRLIAYTTA